MTRNAPKFHGFSYTQQILPRFGREHRDNHFLTWFSIVCEQCRWRHRRHVGPFGFDERTAQGGVYLYDFFLLSFFSFTAQGEWLRKECNRSTPHCDESVRGRGGRVIGSWEWNLLKAMELRVARTSLFVYRGPEIGEDTGGISGREQEYRRMEERGSMAGGTKRKRQE